MLNLFENINIIDRISLIAIILSSPVIIYSIWTYQKIIYDVKKGEIPEALRDFPVYKASPDSYLEAKNKVNCFVDLIVANSKSLEMVIDQDDLNNLYTKGFTPNKYQPGRYFYYAFQENCICEKMIQWPVFGLSAYNVRERIIYSEKLK